MLVAFLSVLSYRYYQRDKSTTLPEHSEADTAQLTEPDNEKHDRAKPFTPRKVAGYILMAISAILLLLIIPEALTYGLLVTSLVMVLVIAVGVAGYAQISPMSLKRFIEWLISAFIVVLLPFAFILPTEYQILIGSLLIIAIALLFYWGLQKIKKEQKKP